MSDFKGEVRARIDANGNNVQLQKDARALLLSSTDAQYSYNFSWLGLPVIQYPQDIVAVQELIWQVKPDLIIETGIAHGGSLIMSASMLALLDYCDAVESGRLLDPAQPVRRVIGIDIDIRAHNRTAIEAHPMANRIDMIQGSSIAAETIDKVHDIASGSDRILVVLDSNHTHDHVLAELEAYAPLTGKDSYCIVFDTVVEGRNVIDTGWDKFNEWSTKEAGVRLLTVIDAGFRDLTTNEAHPVRNLADLRKAKIRVPPNPIMIGAFKSWGVEPMPLAWSETFNALQQKVVDGQENPINVMLAVKFYEVQKYVTNMSYIYQSNFLVASEKWFQSLPADLQAAVVKAGKETTDWEREYIEATTKSDIARLKADHGIIFLGEPEDKPEWVKRARSIWPDYYEFIGKGDAKKGKGIVDEVVKMTADYRAKNK